MHFYKDLIVNALLVGDLKNRVELGGAKSIDEFSGNYQKLLFHDVDGLRKILGCEELETIVTQSFLFQCKSEGKILFDHRSGKHTEKPLLVISHPRSGTHILASILELVGLHQVNVFLDHMDTFCYRLDARQRLIHQYPTGIPLFAASQLFQPGQFTHTHLLHSQWAEEVLPEHFTIITLDRNFESDQEFVRSELFGRAYNLLDNGVSESVLLREIDAGEFDEQIKFVCSEFQLHKSSIAAFAKVADYTAHFEQIVGETTRFVKELTEFLFPADRKSMAFGLRSALIGRLALRQKTLTKRSRDLLTPIVNEKITERISYVL
jgi:hypothetical protein